MSDALPTRMQYAHGGGRFRRGKHPLATYFDRETGDLIERAFEQEARTAPPTTPLDVVYAVAFSNYYPAEVVAVYARREDAEADAAGREGPYHVIEWAVQDRAATAEREQAERLAKAVAETIIQRLHAEAWRTAPEGMGINGWFDVGEASRICHEEAGHGGFAPRAALTGGPSDE